MREKIEQFVFMATAVLSILISILDMFGMLEGISFFANRIPTITLLTVGLATGYLILERRSKLDRIEKLVDEGFDKMLLSLGGGSVKVLADPQELYDYVAQRVKEAKSSFDTLIWGEVFSMKRTESQRRSFQKYLDNIRATTSRREIRGREVMTFPNDEIGAERLERAVELGAKSTYGYQVRYYDINHQNTPPLIQMMIIDSQEVILGSHRGKRLPIEGEVYIAIRHPEVVRFSQDYYDAVWQGGIVLKDAGHEIDNRLLQKIKQQLSTSGQTTA